MCQKIVEEMAQGLSKEAAAASVGVTRQTMHTWTEHHPEFLDAIKLGEELCLEFWERLGVRGAAGLVDGFNATAWIFNMKNRAHWRDKHEVTGEGGGAINININTDAND